MHGPDSFVSLIRVLVEAAAALWDTVRFSIRKRR